MDESRVEEWTHGRKEVGSLEDPGLVEKKT